MNRHNLLILEADKQAARARIAELEAAIAALGPDFYDAFNQTSETWHDNAPFEAVRDRQAVLAAELAHLKSVLASSLPSVPQPKRGIVGIGSLVSLAADDGTTITYLVAGDWTRHAGQTVDGYITVSRRSPLAGALLGKRVGDEIVLRHRQTITAIETAA